MADAIEDPIAQFGLGLDLRSDQAGDARKRLVQPVRVSSASLIVRLASCRLPSSVRPLSIARSFLRLRSTALPFDGTVSAGIFPDADRVR